MKNFRMLIAVVWTLILIFVLLLPSADMPDFRFTRIKGIDKVFHFFVFSITGFVWANVINHTRYRKNLFLLSLMIGLGLGIMTELAQSLEIIGRKFELCDLLANSVGVIFGISIFFFWRDN